jgi:hypothetical protein
VPSGSTNNKKSKFPEFPTALFPGEIQTKQKATIPPQLLEQQPEILRQPGYRRAAFLSTPP